MTMKDLVVTEVLVSGDEDDGRRGGRPPARLDPLRLRGARTGRGRDRAHLQRHVGHPIQQDGLTSGPDGANPHHVPLDEVLEQALTRLRAGDGPGAEAALAAATRTPEDVRVLHLRAVAAHLRRDDAAAERLVAEAISVATDPSGAREPAQRPRQHAAGGRGPGGRHRGLRVQPRGPPDRRPDVGQPRHRASAGPRPGPCREAGLRALELEPRSPPGRAAVTAAVLALTADGAEAEALELVRRWSASTPTILAPDTASQRSAGCPRPTGRPTTTSRRSSTPPPRPSTRTSPVSATARRSSSRTGRRGPGRAGG